MPSLVLHNNFLCLSSIPHVFLVFPFCTVDMAGAEEVHTTCHCSYHKVSDNPTQLHWTLPRLVGTCWLLEDTLRQDEDRYFHTLDKMSHQLFFYSFNAYLAPSCNSLSPGISPSFLSLYFCSHVCTLQQELSGCIHLVTVLVTKTIHFMSCMGHSHLHNNFLFHHLLMTTIFSFLVIIHLDLCCDT